jgi:protein transport protein SEC31
VTAVAWNRKVEHILCSTSNTGDTVVWDLKKKKEVINFRDPANRSRCSTIAWNPDQATQLLIAYDDDRNPSLQMWDFRNASFPFKEFAGHDKGITCASWNEMDSNLLVSCGKDNKTICWNMSNASPEVFSEVSTQAWNKEVQWAPHMPGIISTSSFNGQVGVHSTQTSRAPGVKYAPKWFERPVGATFGFGGRVVSFEPKKTTACVHVVPTDPDLVARADHFENNLANRDFRGFCQEKLSQAQDPHEKLSWEVIELLFETDGRAKIVSKLGFNSQQIIAKAECYLGHPRGDFGNAQLQPEEPVK